jgi:hypothetical protein
MTAHARGDDRVARHDAHVVVRLLPLVRGFLREQNDASQTGQWRYLDVAEDLARDQDRRFAEGSRPPLPPIPATGAVPAELVPVLIEHLDDVVAPDHGFPLGVFVHEAPIVDALIRAGGAAVLPLIDVFEHDTRLTRTVVHGDPFAYRLQIRSVHVAADSALYQILGGAFLIAGETIDQRARLMREFWARYGQYPPAERAYRILANDRESQHLHDWAAGQLGAAAAADGELMGGPSALARLRSLRAPSVTELLVRRMEEDLRYGCSYVYPLSAWAPSQAPGLLRGFAHRCVRAGACWCEPLLVDIVAPEDPSVLDDYGRWLRGDHDVADGARIYAPIAQFPGAPAIQSVIDWLFRDGPFAPYRARQGAGSIVRMLVDSRTFEVPRVRARVADALRAEDVAGTLRNVSDGVVAVVHGGGWFGVSVSEPVTAPRTIRTGDLYADAVAHHLGVPFSLAWERTRRDAAIEEMRARLLAR